MKFPYKIFLAVYSVSVKHSLYVQEADELFFYNI